MVDLDLIRGPAFLYRAIDPRSGAVEYEFDRVFLGRYDGRVTPNSDEVADIRWMDLADLDRAFTSAAADYVPWLPHALIALHAWRNSERSSS